MKNKTEQFDVPILFIIFRRKDTALQVINAIAKVKPKKLYISQDGPRNKAEEKEVLETRKAVLSKINWKCDLTVWTHDKNLGLKKHIPGAFDKFFEKEDMGIYLEDDTLPSKEFFYFEQDLLKRYRNDSRIFSINGVNVCPNAAPRGITYHLTQLAGVWGMGIWKRSWKLYSPNVTDLHSFSYHRYKDYLFSYKYWLYLTFFLNLVKNKKLNTWDYQLAYSGIKNKMYFICPSCNLVNNIGINKKGTNIFLQNYKIKSQKKSNNTFQVKHPVKLTYSNVHDVTVFNTYKHLYIRMFLNLMYYASPTLVQNIVKKTIYRIN